MQLRGRVRLEVSYSASDSRVKSFLASGLLAIGLFTPTFLPAYAADSDNKLADLGDLSLEQLSNIQVTSVSRHAENIQDAAASVYVITADDIRRSGVTSLPEALRLAPNLEVARVNSSQYAISARGFNNSIGNKLLVMIDGRTVYTPLYSGVFWDAQDVMLEDIDRIEVISGPGATLWGSNAVNGVINIITRSAKDTQGTLLAAGGGNTEKDGAARYGGELDSGGHYRVYGMGFDRSGTETATGATQNDAWGKGQVGFRSDWDGNGRNFTLQGDAYDGEEDQGLPGTTRLAGLNLLTRYDRQLDNGSDVQVQAYYDRTQRNEPGAYAEELDTFDVELQHSIQLTSQNQLLWGGGYRYSFDRVENSAVIAFLPADADLAWGNLFAQDEISLRTNLNLTLGARLESNPYTNVQVLPTARLAWKLTPDQLIWGDMTRAVRAPSRLDRDLFSPSDPPYLLAGGPNFQSEVSDVYETGYRAQPLTAVSYSVTLFHQIYEHLRSLEPTDSGGFVIANEMSGTGNGVEAWGDYQATRTWRLSAGLLELRQELGLDPGSHDFTGPSAEGNDPKYQWTLRSSINITDTQEFDLSVRRVGALPDPAVPAYTALDARFGWQVQHNVELSLTGQNLLGPQHIEFGAPATASEIGRSLFLKLLWRM